MTGRKKAYNYILDNPKNESYRVQFHNFKWAAEYGHPAGQYHLVNCYLQSLGCEKSEEKAAEWYTKVLLNGYELLEQCLKEIIRHKSGGWAPYFSLRINKLFIFL